ncbi:MAG: DUF6377 domain-containing protein [Bacteroidaceae bacterium]|nr:DUF6377 domain-containing protein [Bacteroidaceae bacterium]
MKAIHILYSLSLILVCSCTGRYSTATQENLFYFAQVEEALNNKETYLEDFNNSINEIHQRLANSMDRESIYIYQRLLAEMYMGYEADSALAYIDKNLQRAEELKRTDWIAESLILRSQTYNTSGMIDESREALNKVKGLPMGQDIKLKYLMEELTYWRYYAIQFNLPSPYPMITAYADSIVQLVPDPSSPYYNYAKSYQIAGTSELKEWQPELMRFADSLDEKNPWYKYITECTALTAWANGDIDNRLKYFALSLISKIQQVDRHVPYLADLGTIAREMGELTYAARFYNATLRIQADHPEYVYNGDGALARSVMQFHEVVEDRLEQQNARNQMLNYLLTLFIVLAIILLIVTMLELKKVRSLHQELKQSNEQLKASEANLRQSNEQLKAKEQQLTETNTELTEANYIKEEYIGQLFATCSDYIDKMDALKKNINRKLKAGQYAEAIKQTAATSQRENEYLQELWTEFDKVFLRLYPDFIEQFNTLLREEEQINIKPEIRLNTDLRIYALIRLGIDSSVKISKMLGVSVQTVYNARTKMRSKAISANEDFDLSVKQLKPAITKA